MRVFFALQLDAAVKAVFHSGMNKISLWFLILTFAAGVMRGQDAAAQQQIDKLTGQIQDLLEAQAQHGRSLDTLNREISELREKVNTPVLNSSASRDDLKALAEKVQEIDRKRQEDRELILKEIEKLGKLAAVPTPHSKPSVPKRADDTSSASAGQQKGFEYSVKAGDSLGAIAKAYHDQGVKVTAAQILKANPGLDANKLYVGKKIFIPDPSAK